MTAPREAILAALGRLPGHPSADEIFVAVRRTHPAVGLTTVYRTLDMLERMGEVFRTDSGDGKARYELVKGSRAADHHHHLVCTSCRRIVDYTDFIDDEIELLRKTERALSTKYGFEIKSHVIQFYGLCARCRKAAR